MTIPYYRYVRYTEDGCGIEECLNCKATWEWRGGSGTVRFCMYCGVEFRGRLECRDSETPRWMHDLKLRLGDAYYRLESRWWNRLRRPKPYWALEERSFLLQDGGEHLLRDWHVESPLNHVNTAHQAYHVLVAKRREEAIRDTPDDPDYDPMVDPPPRRFCRYEYRLRRVAA